MKVIKKFIKKYWDLIILIFLIAIYAITFSTLSILRHNAFASNYDLANMSQTVWNTLHGRPFELSGAEGTISRFSIHADLILVLLSPLYLIWERAYMLLMAQSIALGLGAIPVYFLSINVLGNIVKGLTLKFVALALSLVYLLNPAMEWTNIYDFHGVALAIPFLISAFYFAYVGKWRWFWVFVLLSLIAKEEISLLISMLGLAIFFVFKKRAIGAATFLIGISWFLVMIFIVIPKFSMDRTNWVLGSLYAPALQKLAEIQTISQAMDLFRGYFLIPSAFHYYIALMKPFSFMPILGLPWLLLAVPEFAVNLLSTNSQMQALTFHYDSGIAPFLIIATIFGLKYFLSSLKFKSLSRYKEYIPILVTVTITIVAIRVNYHYSPLPTTPSCWCLSYQVTRDDVEFAKVLTTIPRNASVTSSGEVRPHIARRENSFTLPGHVDTAEYVAILDENRIVGDYSPKEFENALLKDPNFLSKHKLINHIGHFYLFKKR